VRFEEEQVQQHTAGTRRKEQQQGWLRKKFRSFPEAEQQQVVEEQHLGSEKKVQHLGSEKNSSRCRRGRRRRRVADEDEAGVAGQGQLVVVAGGGVGVARRHAWPGRSGGRW